MSKCRVLVVVVRHFEVDVMHRVIDILELHHLRLQSLRHPRTGQVALCFLSFSDGHVNDLRLLTDCLPILDEPSKYFPDSDLSESSKV